jgi:small-conductance mechanosensitive channel
MRTTLRLFAFLAWLFSPGLYFGAAAATDVDWSGSWDTRWRDGGARLDLRQSGDVVNGTYPLYEGAVEAVANSRELTGKWMAGPRSGSFTFVMGLDGRTFVGRYDNGEWWTGARLSEAAPTLPVDRSDVRETFRTFIRGGNLANAGLVENLGAAAAVLDVSKWPGPVLSNQRLEIARNLFDVVSLTTFQIWNLPGPRLPDAAFTVKLHQAGTDAALSLTLRRGTDGNWSIVAPTEDELSAARKALLARSGGRRPEPSAHLKLQTARDTFIAFQSAFADWDRGGRERVINTLDTSELFPATRDYEAQLAAQYLKLTLDRVSTAVPQEIPDDPADRQPYVVFSHPIGAIAIAPVDTGGKVVWRFTPDTLRTIRALYANVEAMPLANARVVEPPTSTFFAERGWFRRWAPGLMRPVGPVESWQMLAGVLGAFLCLVAATLGTTLLTPVLRWAGGVNTHRAELALRWPLRLVIAALLFKLLIPLLGWPEEVRRYSAPIHAVIIGVFGVWAAWYLIDILTQSLSARARETPSSIDDITISLCVSAIRLAVASAAVGYVATEFSIPTNGIIAGLGLSGLAVAFASKETLSNVFGAGILMADRPFKKGDLITAGDIHGTVEQVGIRSTRIRTSEDTQIVVPNGKLSDASINNWGDRKYRLFQAKIRVGYGATTAQIERFMAKLQDMFVADKAIAPDRTEVGISALGDSSIEIEANTYLSIVDPRDERAVRNRLILEMLRLAETEGIKVGAGPS